MCFMGLLDLVSDMLLHIHNRNAHKKMFTSWWQGVGENVACWNDSRLHIPLVLFLDTTQCHNSLQCNAHVPEF